jgi:hypothetical protein
VVERIKGMVTVDPLKDIPVGFTLSFEPFIFPKQTVATEAVQSINDWQFFEGTILSVSVRSVEGTTVLGTAVCIAPGLAITAAHLFTEQQIAQIAGGTLSPFCTGITSDGMDFWIVRSVVYTPHNDIAYLTIEMRSALAQNRPLRSAVLTTRRPVIGETLSLVGFRMEAVEDAEFRGHLYIAAGPVEDFLLEGWGRSRPTPLAQVGCATLGRMSGGAAFDSDGLLIGIISSGINPAESPAASFVALPVNALNREMRISWPRGYYKQPIHLLDIDQRVLLIEGRERIRLIEGGASEYEPDGD